MSDVKQTFVVIAVMGPHPETVSRPIFATDSEKEAVILTDLLSQYAVFRERFQEDLWEWEFKYAAETQPELEMVSVWARQRVRDKRDFIDKNYQVDSSLQVVENILFACDVSIDPDEEWPEDVAFEYRVLPVFGVEENANPEEQ